MKKFSLVSQAELDKINAASLRGLGPERQVAAMRTWTDQNIKKYGSCGSQDTDEEMQQFLQEMGNHLGLYTGNPTFHSALKLQKGWGNEWMMRVIDKNSRVIDFAAHSDLRDATLRNVLRKIVEDSGKGHHGAVTMSGSSGSCLHWVSGSVRIFGTFANNKLTLVGIGRHGGTNSTYNVSLITGGTATAHT
jgi:hypothetical protein